MPCGMDSDGFCEYGVMKYENGKPAPCYEDSICPEEEWFVAK
jgi:hypothetical protein